MKNNLNKFNLKKQEKKIVLVFVGAVLFYTIFILFADVKKILQVSARFNWSILPVLLFFSFLNYLVRFFRFHYLLKKSNINLPLKKTFNIFFAGISMTVTPGKSGEVLKSYLLKKEKGITYSETVPILIFERLTDGIAMIILALGGIYLFRQSIVFFIFSAIMVLVFVALVFQRQFVIAVILNLEKRFPKIKILDFAVNFLESAKKLFKKDIFTTAVFYGIAAWALEGISLFILINLIIRTQVSLSWSGLFYSFFIFSFCSIAGFLVLIPAGIGVAEASVSSFLMLFFKMSLSQSIFASLLFRIVTLWFGVSLGLIFLIKNLSAKS